jgi:N-acetylneuraminic acid mutarotase
MMGGSNFPGVLNDFWKYTPSTNMWTWVSGDNVPNQTGIYGTKGTADPGNKPGSRGSAISWVDAVGNLLLMGGTGYSSSTSQGYLNDLWKYNPTTNQWTWISGDNAVNQSGIYGIKGVIDANNKPGGRSGAVSWIDVTSNLWLMGGYGYLSSTSQSLLLLT